MHFHTRLISFLAAVALAVSTPAAHAGLKDAIDGMFMSNGTAPQAFDSQSRGGFVGGSLAMRAPIRNINLVTLDPPRFSAGCGGIDMFGGSFSFINADQLVALFRQIAANAVGLAFKVAIDAINPALGKAMQEFQSKIQALNEMSKNTCSVANSLVKTLSDPDARANLVQDATTAIGTAKGAFSDLMEGSLSFFSGSGEDTTKDLNMAGQCPQCGNVVWKSIVTTQAGKQLGNPSTSTNADEVQTNELIMSLIGAFVLSENTASAPSAPGAPDQKPAGASFSPTLGLIDLVDGASDGKLLKYLKCTDGTEANQCTSPKETQLVFLGMKGYVNKMLFGSEDGVYAGASASSIVGKLQGCSSATDCKFSQAQKDFLNSIQTPTLALLRQVQASPAAVEHVAVRLVPLMANEMGLHYGEAALKAVRSAFAGGKYPKPQEVAAAELERAQELTELRRREADLVEKTMSVKEFVRAVVSSNPGIFARTKD